LPTAPSTHTSSCRRDEPAAEDYGERRSAMPYSCNRY
jgi:hypothetical protein